MRHAKAAPSHHIACNLFVMILQTLSQKDSITTRHAKAAPSHHIASHAIFFVMILQTFSQKDSITIRTAIASHHIACNLFVMIL